MTARTARQIDGDGAATIPRLTSREFFRNPHPALARIRETTGAAAVELNGVQTWIVARYSDGRRLLNDPSVGKTLATVREHTRRLLVRTGEKPRSSLGAVGVAVVQQGLGRSMFECDGADHRRLRGLLTHAFTTEKMAEYRPAVEGIVDFLLDGLPTGERVDLVGSFTRPLASTLLSELLGIPRRYRDEFPDFENTIITAPSAQEAFSAGDRMDSLCRELIALKRAEPGHDLLTELVDAEREGTLDEDELVSTVFLLLIAGVEPTNAIANGVLTLLTHPEQLARLLDEPALIGGCVDEILRYEASFRMLPARHCSCPIELDEVTIPADSLVIVANSAANRDSRQFAHADTFDVTRASRSHLAFGHGPHRCLGAPLGRLEMAVALGRFFARFPNTRLAVAPGELRWRAAPFLRRLESLPVVLA